MPRSKTNGAPHPREQEVVSLLRAGRSSSEAARELGMSPTLVYQICHLARRRGVDVPNGRKLSEETKRVQILAMHRAGSSNMQIARSLNVSYGHVCVELSRARKVGILPEYAPEGVPETRAGRPVAVPSAIMEGLRPHAEKRGVTVHSLIRDILFTVMEEDLTDGVLDDGFV